MSIVAATMARDRQNPGPVMNRKERRRLKVTHGQQLDRMLAERKCAACTGCCTVLAIEELDKPAGVPCQHLSSDGGGCGIYETRPKACREYDCGWRLGVGTLEQRPDRMGVVMSPIAPGLPGHPGAVVHELWPDAFDDAQAFLADVARGLVLLLIRDDLIKRVMGPEDRIHGMKSEMEVLRRLNAETRAAKGLGTK
jgi:hypothetical protein